MFFRLFIFLFLFGMSILGAARLVTAFYAQPRTFTLQNIPSQSVAIVFGAGLWRDGSPTPVLRDRVATAVELYFNKKVQKLLMSGDNQYSDYNEPGAMREYAIELGVPSEDIILDYAGRRTYDTCYRAKAIFGLENAILVTQSFHLPRAIYICNQLGLQAIGIAADLREYRPRSLFYWNLREIPATVAALWEVNFTHPLPVLGDPEPIFPKE
jgi:SanA protein